MTIFTKTVAMAVIVALGCGVVGTPRAHATSDWVKVLGGVAAGYLISEALKDDDHARIAVRTAHRYPPANPYPSYNPPSNRYGYYETPRQVYNEGYRDGFQDGTQYGYGEGWKDGKRVGFSQGYDKGFDRGYGRGYDNGWDDRGDRRAPPAWRPSGGGGYGRR